MEDEKVIDLEKYITPKKKEMSDKKKKLMIILDIILILLLVVILIYSYVEVEAIKHLWNEGDLVGTACEICMTEGNMTCYSTMYSDLIS
ncbi:MAG: hypothetical protein ACFFG0_07910 [Candidatus Thorarchaeota archaeon]